MTDGNVYICDRAARRVQVFDKMGTFKKNIPIISLSSREANTHLQDTHPGAFISWAGPGGWGTAVDIDFSRDRAQKFIVRLANEDDEQVEILDRASGVVRSCVAFRSARGHQIGEFNHIHYAWR